MGKFQDISNKQFGSVTVLYLAETIKNKTNTERRWMCLCKCGNTKSISGSYLRSGKDVSCGCNLLAINDLSGKKYGRLTVLNCEGRKLSDSGKYKKTLWKCECVCGKEAIVTAANLVSGSCISCGCYHDEVRKKCKYIDLHGQKFGILTVLKDTGVIKHGHRLWTCICECGKEKEISGTSLNKGLTKSCGCGKKRSKDEEFSHKIRRTVSSSIRMALKANSSSKRGKSALTYLPYSIQELRSHLESQFETWMNWDNYGGLPNDPRLTWHIDHIIPQSRFQYTSMEDQQFLECWALSNLRPLEKIANLIKGDK